MLRIENLHAGYGPSRVLFGMDLCVEAGSVVSLIGRNGMGKTTTVMTIMGLIRPTQGRVYIGGADMTGRAPHRIAQAGMGLVPEGRRVFPSLSVRENLLATASAKRSHKWTLDKVYDLFPRLRERERQSARTLSGGEQQMLALGRALMTNPAMLILDEASEGLAPVIRTAIWDCLVRLKAEGETILVIDKNLKEMARVVDRHLVIEKGRLVWTGSPAQLAAAPEISHRYLGV
ncbi:ABC transporter ATP-binding protein [Verticiella sediminum]|uniref:ABC transporter ATP-binding protein n=1 Tax=Verticiella sediminum TaxID=1247510 RepID=A0A556AXN7_9BURK|nr:ABC transporter ATP-binding protein [Verticiella sediminum]TSH97656.1 ABC transporter ATP-binding protein [Verticiella sediminum]